MTATTLSRLPLLAGSAAAASLGRAGTWIMARYMRAPLASTGMLALVTLTAMAASNALYFQTTRHPQPFFAPAMNVPEAVTAPQPLPALERPAAATMPAPVATSETTGSVAPAAQVPEAPVGNAEAFAVQKKLTELGLFNGKVDGFYGPMTANAIRAFEQRNGLTPTGALTRNVIDAILRADATGRTPVAQPAPAAQPAPVVQPAPVAQPEPVIVQAAAQPQPDRVVAVLPTLSPVDQAVDTIGNAAAQTLDGIVAAVDGSRSTPAQPAVPPVPAAALAMTQPQPAQIAPATPADTAPVAPANNTQLVSQIQTGLARLGFYHGSIDGHPGDATARAIREFENFHSYRVTGQIKPDLVGLLRQAGAAI